MADDSETAVKPPAPPRPHMMEGNGNSHEHCSDCENEEDNSYIRGGLSPANDTGGKKKKKKQKKKKEKGGETDPAQDQPVKMNSLPAERIQEIQKAIELFSVGQGPAKTMEEASKRSYQFWDTQPVPKLGRVRKVGERVDILMADLQVRSCRDRRPRGPLGSPTVEQMYSTSFEATWGHGPAGRVHGAWMQAPVQRLGQAQQALGPLLLSSGQGEVVNTHGPVEPDKDNIRQEPYTLPQGFTWDALDLGDRGVLKELYTLLNENYVEETCSDLITPRSFSFGELALRPPGWLPQWHCGVRVVSSRKLVGFISAIPASIHIYDIEKKMVEINFLCVHKKLRSKRVAPVLIREITRRVHLEGVFQAVYTAGVVLPKPVGTCRYWHRSLNPRKLIEVKFSHLSRNMTMQRTMKLYRLPEASGARTWAGQGGAGRAGNTAVAGVPRVRQQPCLSVPLFGLLGSQPAVGQVQELLASVATG
ncbi:Glycylpeptide N-tetradecanoyltransferase 1 [Heterocephalus glaber]|uniref:Glycylpeptide N-tetradecanoyltransferase 1 n=1 Tax=Heterocephalus glaber TaxID=10181 RepID=G5BJ12_HETGA|nr:Glycylpeptide N-tetradecanoyltransferase 1 [Heterocephalus glaber]